MELRSYNVEHIYKDAVKCRIGTDLGIDKKAFKKAAPDIKDMLSQIETLNGEAHLCACNKRKDGETWTPYLQIVEMLILMGKKLGLVQFESPLKETTLIKILCHK